MFRSQAVRPLTLALTLLLPAAARAENMESIPQVVES